METIIDLHICPTREPIESSHNIHGFRKYFFINFEFNHAYLPFQTNVTTDLTTTIREAVTIPIENLCNCMEGDYNNVYEKFSFIPINILDEILPKMEECARQMVAHYGEEHDIIEMSIHLFAITPIEEEEEDLRNQDDFDQAQQIVDLMEKLEMCYLSSSDSTGQCPICLEEFCITSEFVRTNCSYVFHKKCIASWIQQCINCSSTYTCPLCRQLL
ncbi:hypothetical protein RYX36_034950 [Vicia faba]